MSATHASDCAIHNEPALPAGDCDCGADPRMELSRDLNGVLETISFHKMHLHRSTQEMEDSGNPVTAAQHRFAAERVALIEKQIQELSLPKSDDEG